LTTPAASRQVVIGFDIGALRRHTLEATAVPVVPFLHATFTNADLEFLYALWPKGRLVRGRDSDTFIVAAEGQLHWLRISRTRTGSYLSHNSNGKVYAEGNALSELSLDGVSSPP
jgi:hypothetical protein